MDPAEQAAADAVQAAADLRAAQHLVAAHGAAPFALVPGDVLGIIDYSTRQGLSIFSQATRSLYEDPADCFNVESAGLQTFLALIRHRGTTCGWDLEVPQDVADPLNNNLDITTNHGRFTLEHLRTYSETLVHTQTRNAQENIQVVKCILSSLSLPGFRKVQTWHDDWHINGRPSAFLLIKIIVREAFIDTQATTRILREHLSSLPSRLEDLKGDIDQLNAFIKVTQDQLSARGETTNDLLSNLFKGYLSSRDVTFRRYMEKKQEDYDDGTAFTIDGLMNQASNKFKSLVQSGKWMAPTDEQAKIIALEAKLSKMNKKPATSASSSGNRNQSNQKQGSSGNSSKKNGKKPIPAWMTKWPGKAFVDADQSKVVEGKTHWWCKKHKRFCQHKTSDCRKPSNFSSSSANQGSSNVASSSSHSATAGSPSNPVPSIRVSTATLMDE